MYITYFFLRIDVASCMISHASFNRIINHFISIFYIIKQIIVSSILFLFAKKKKKMIDYDS